MGYTESGKYKVLTKKKQRLLVDEWDDVSLLKEIWRILKSNRLDTDSDRYSFHGKEDKRRNL